ncbi:MAG: hypothetical protein GY765_07455 [bacterium]|nr:hypothetical protein [bacterium]
MNINDYNTKIETIQAIEEKDLEPISIPVRVFAQEGEDLYVHCLPDRTLLEPEGLSWELVEDIPIRVGALRQAQSLLLGTRNLGKEAEKQWAGKAPEAEDLVTVLMHRFRFACRDNPELLGRLKEIGKGEKYSDLIQSLNDLCAFGQLHAEVVNAGNFDTTMLDTAAAYSNDLCTVRAHVNANRKETQANKRIRDQAYTHLKNAVDQVREYGRFVFWRNSVRLKGYSSEYLRRPYVPRSVAEPEENPVEEPISPDGDLPLDADIEAVE